MNKSAIKNFAIWARNKLIADISYKAGLLGITDKEIKSPLPQSTKDAQFFDIGSREPYQITGTAIAQRRHLVNKINEKARQSDYATAYKTVMEEVAYTWFNRLIAVRFMEVNDYLPSRIRMLSSATGKAEPDIVTTPFDTDLDFTAAEREYIIACKTDNKLDELFRMLFIKQCNALNAILPELFERVGDYAELLLNISFTDKEGILHRLIYGDGKEKVSEDDFKEAVEIIGWMYQYYNTEPKDETFALLKKNVKITKERIPAATQLFTPNWIVRYMVENSLGRLWLEGHSNDTLKAGWKYYLDEAEQTPEVQAQLEQIRVEYRGMSLEDITFIDPCMGSGHILVYAFDVFMQIYESAGYIQRDAARLILEKNIHGLDIDKRAYQLAYFALFMKARQYNRRIFDGTVAPQVYHPVGWPDGEEYGSLIKIDKIELKPEQTKELTLFDLDYEKSLRVWNFKRLLAQKYDVVVTNPPYMGGSGMNGRLAQFIKYNCPDSKSDASTAFMEQALFLCKGTGLMSMINIPVWMFLSSYEKLREKIISQNTLTSMLHFGRGIFGSDFGSTGFVLRKKHIKNYKGSYRRLFEKQGAVDTVEQKEKWFFDGMGVFKANSNNFIKIPGNPIAYWVNEKMYDNFLSPTISDYSTVTNGMFTCDNKRFLRLWHEVNDRHIFFNCFSKKQSIDSDIKWYPYNKGGEFRRWYGNHENIINFKNFGDEVSNYRIESGQSASFPGQNFYFKESLSWSFVSSSKFGIRYYPNGFVFDIAGSSIFPNDKNDLHYLLGLLASEVSFYILGLYNPTINFQAGDIKAIPTIVKHDVKKEISEYVVRNIKISRNEWNSYETSWDFKRHPLI